MLKANHKQHEELANKISSDYIQTNSVDNIESFVTSQHLTSLKEHIHRVILGFSDLSPDDENFTSFLDEYAGLIYDVPLTEKLTLAKLNNQLGH